MYNFAGNLQRFLGQTFRKVLYLFYAVPIARRTSPTWLVPILAHNFAGNSQKVLGQTFRKVRYLFYTVPPAWRTFPTWLVLILATQKQVTALWPIRVAMNELSTKCDLQLTSIWTTVDCKSDQATEYSILYNNQYKTVELYLSRRGVENTCSSNAVILLHVFRLISLLKDQVSNLNSHGISAFYVTDCADQQLQDDMFLNSNQRLAKLISTCHDFVARSAASHPKTLQITSTLKLMRSTCGKSNFNQKRQVKKAVNNSELKKFANCQLLTSWPQWVPCFSQH